MTCASLLARSAERSSISCCDTKFEASSVLRRVSVAARPGHTTFTIALPVAPPEAQARAVAPEASAAHS